MTWILFVVFLDIKVEDKNSAPNDSMLCLIFINKEAVMSVVYLSVTYTTV